MKIISIKRFSLMKSFSTFLVNSEIRKKIKKIKKKKQDFKHQKTK